jgi:hypothetical protein
MSPSAFSCRPVAVTTMSAASSLPGLQAHAGGGEGLDVVGDHRRTAVAQHLEQVAVGHHAQALVPGLVGRREVRHRVAGRAELVARHLQQPGARNCAGRARASRYVTRLSSTFLKRTTR